MIILIIWNVIVFLIWGTDKYRAIKGEWRISEKTLISSAFFLGGIGALFGMRIFRHKTKKPLFGALIPIAAVITAYAALVLEGGFIWTE